MTFIKAGFQQRQRVRLTQDVSVMAGTFKAGTEMQITGSGPRGYDLVDDEGNQLLECGVINPGCFEKL